MVFAEFVVAPAYENAYGAKKIIINPNLVEFIEEIADSPEGQRQTGIKLPDTYRGVIGTVEEVVAKLQGGVEI
jgi:hypothetical protein